MSDNETWVDGCRVVDVGIGSARLIAVDIGLAEQMKDYKAPMSESASRANEIIRNMMKAS